MSTDSPRSSAPRRRREAAITIRRAVPSDAEALAAVFAGPKALRGTLQLPFPSPEVWRTRIAQESETTLISLVACPKGDLAGVVGVVGLHLHSTQPRRAHAAELGMTVRDDWQGRGVGHALLAAALDMADRWLPLRRVQLTVFVDNAAAIHLYRKHGFETEGTLREFGLRDGQYMDVLLMARLRPK